ncbi:MAG: SurA N-terminal domain-containing protein [Brevinematia bacterium]
MSIFFVIYFALFHLPHYNLSGGRIKMSDIVMVNEEVITDEMFNAFYKRVIYELQEDENFEITEENRKFIKTEVLNSLIERVVLLQEAKKENITISDKDVLLKLNDIKSAGPEEELKNELEQLGLDEASLFDEIKKEEMINQYLASHGLRDISFTESELRDFYENNKEFIKEPDMITFYEIYVENEDNAVDVSESLKSLSSIEEIDGRLKKDNLDYFFHSGVPEYKLPAELFEAIAQDLITDGTFTLKLETGYFIYKIIERKIGRKPSYEEIKKDLAEYLINQAKTELRQKILEELMEKAKIEYLDVSLLFE